MDVTELIRDKDRILKVLKELEDGSVVCLEPIKAYIPKRFEDKGFAELGKYVDTYAVIGLVLNDKYYCSISAMTSYQLMPAFYRTINLTIPSLNAKNQVVKEPYIEMEFEKGDTLISTLISVIQPELPYYFFSEFLWLSKIPWYLDRREISQLFDLSKSQTKAVVGSKPQVLRLINSYAFRDPDSFKNPYRYSEAMKHNEIPLISSCNNRALLVEGTIFKLMSRELNKNIVASLLEKDNQVTELEEIVKGSPDD